MNISISSVSMFMRKIIVFVFMTNEGYHDYKSLYHDQNLFAARSNDGEKRVAKLLSFLKIKYHYAKS